MKNGVAPNFSVVLDGILFILTGNDDIHLSLDEFEIRPDPTTELAALKRLKKFMFQFFLALYNRSQVSIVALWATCLNLRYAMLLYYATPWTFIIILMYTQVSAYFCIFQPLASKIVISRTVTDLSFVE